MDKFTFWHESIYVLIYILSLKLNIASKSDGRVAKLSDEESPSSIGQGAG